MVSWCMEQPHDACTVVLVACASVNASTVKPHAPGTLMQVIFAPSWTAWQPKPQRWRRPTVLPRPRQRTSPQRSLSQLSSRQGTQRLQRELACCSRRQIPRQLQHWEATLCLPGLARPRMQSATLEMDTRPRTITAAPQPRQSDQHWWGLATRSKEPVALQSKQAPRGAEMVSRAPAAQRQAACTGTCRSRLPSSRCLLRVRMGRLRKPLCRAHRQPCRRLTK